MQQPPIQLLQLTTCFYWNENFDYALMDILEKIGIHHWNMFIHCSTLFIIQILLKTKLKIIFNTYKFFLKTQNYICVDEILANPFTSVSLIKVLRNPKIQMEHSH
jgi:hypothetical protein